MTSVSAIGLLIRINSQVDPLSFKFLSNPFSVLTNDEIHAIEVAGAKGPKSFKLNGNVLKRRASLVLSGYAVSAVALCWYYGYNPLPFFFGSEA